jgi:hypothetical protein
MADPIAEPHYPPQNGMGPPSNQRWYVDDIMGDMHPEAQVVRDRKNRLRNIDDIDEPDRDDILEVWSFPSEEAHEDP